ncbi:MULTISPECIES: PH domain-containing protein [Lactobacillus]|jgi:hypothetical protein|uniref:PH domain-containing protein n=1 Tax=Lactobacillus mulieris TaxID=2508708 RepID=A0AAP3GXZ4_9LACO|nr:MULTISPECIES: PH domain-containing protein [Lactobacillus]EEU20737.1 hypothetical protein HMPREF0525_01317 [Lactobacillus jensenii 27-2-CHN]EEX23728.1 hypothetical protein HMPREF0974_00796 [Lactobacillus jensenii 115-3-CHN]EFH29862.1 hypothetical protein HMPREF0526_10015 [Lactobacillus jensenii JV-V16]KAA9243349.1 hypothetical protein F6I33_07730 [Lactobacillus jensenii]KAA9361582.1 hypothetical protein F6I25_07810 [Lactobacillus jensenii]
MRNKLSIENNNLIVEPQGLDKLWSLKNKLVIPLKHIAGATLDNTILFDKKGLRSPGTAALGYYAGSFHLNNEINFYNARKGSDIIVIQLKEEHYNRLILEIDNPRQWIDKLNNI